MRSRDLGSKRCKLFISCFAQGVLTTSKDVAKASLSRSSFLALHKILLWFSGVCFFFRKNTYFINLKAQMLPRNILLLHSRMLNFMIFFLRLLMFIYDTRPNIDISPDETDVWLFLIWKQALKMKIRKVSVAKSEEKFIWTSLSPGNWVSRTF